MPIARARAFKQPPVLRIALRARSHRTNSCGAHSQDAQYTHTAKREEETKNWYKTLKCSAARNTITPSRTVRTGKYGIPKVKYATMPLLLQYSYITLAWHNMIVGPLRCVRRRRARIDDVDAHTHRQILQVHLRSGISCVLHKVLHYKC